MPGANWFLEFNLLKMGAALIIRAAAFHARGRLYGGQCCADGWRRRQEKDLRLADRKLGKDNGKSSKLAKIHARSAPRIG